MKYIVWTVVNKNKKINLNRTSFYKDKDFAIAEAELRNQSVVEKDKPYKIKKATLILE